MEENDEVEEQSEASIELTPMVAAAAMPDAMAAPLRRNQRPNQNFRKPTPTPTSENQHQRSVRRNQRQAAAVVLQKHSRGYMMRARLAQMNQAALLIQKQFRGHLVRQRMKLMSLAATVIQTGFRRHQDHRRHDQLMAAVRGSGGLASRHGHKRRALYISQYDGSDSSPYGGTDGGHAVRFQQPPAVRIPVAGGVLCFGGLASDADDGNDDDVAGSAIYSLDVRSGQWQKAGRLPLPRFGLAACQSSDGDVYVSGGHDPTASGHRPMPTPNVWRLEVASGRWQPAPSLRVARQQHGMACLDRRVYVVGGSDAEGCPLDSVESCEPRRETGWRMEPPLERPRMLAGVTAHDGGIWVCGGITEVDGERRITSRVDVLELNENASAPVHRWRLQIHIRVQSHVGRMFRHQGAPVDRRSPTACALTGRMLRGLESPLILRARLLQLPAGEVPTVVFSEEFVKF